MATSTDRTLKYIEADTEDVLRARRDGWVPRAVVLWDLVRSWGAIADHENGLPKKNWFSRMVPATR